MTNLNELTKKDTGWPIKK